MTATQIDQALADRMVEKALMTCADKHFSGDRERARQSIQRGRCEICSCLSDSLVEQISQYLGEIDKTVKAVYQYEPVAERQSFQWQDDEPAKSHNGINLVAWVDRKSAALNALVETLETALSASQRKIGCVNASTACYTLDVQMVDDQDVGDRRGYGLLVENKYLRSKPVWERVAGERQHIPPKVTAEPAIPEDILPETFDPEIIPESRLLHHASIIEQIPPEQRADLEHHLTELKVILIRRMISDQLAYIDIAKNWFTISDLENIYNRRIGFGRVGGKAAGMLLAARILEEVAEDDVIACIQVPESYFLGSDLIYIFMAMNGLLYWNDQKYRAEAQIWADYPQIVDEFQAGRFPPEVVAELEVLLASIGDQPLIVRSSSQLEDNFGTSFAGKYESFFCPNQGTAEENLSALMRAITRTYASTLRPEALLYRRSKGLEDYDERMAVLIQVVQGEQFGRYHLPFAAGVAFSHNLFRWSPEIRRQDGFARLVWGLGTRAVQRVGDDYPRLVALSHPTLQPDDSTEAIRRYSQHYVDVIDLEENSFKTVPVEQVLSPRYPLLRYLAQLEQDGYFTTPRMRVSEEDLPRLTINFYELLQRTQFAGLLSKALRLIERHYHSAVDMEFTVHIPDPRAIQPEVRISLLQCRPQSHLQDSFAVQLPKNLSSEDVVFSTRFMVPQGYLPNIRHLLFVKPEAYFALPTAEERNKVGVVISRLNAALGEKSFICVGPGRWGTKNADLGVFVSYADIYNAGALVEISGKGIGPAPEPSLGTHFFQDLMEAQIYPLVIRVDDEEAEFNRDLFYNTPNCLTDWLDVEGSLLECLHLIDIAAYRPDHHVEVVMDDGKRNAVAFLVPDE
jgi:hypothetical protein